MSSSVRAERDNTTPTDLAPLATSVTGEQSIDLEELGDALYLEQQTLRHDVMLWQRWVRYLALGAMVLLSLAFGTIEQAALIPLTVIAGCYTAVVMTTAFILRRTPSDRSGRWFPSLLLSADIATLAGFCFLTTPPQQFHRILLIGFLSMQLSVFHFGRGQGTLAIVLTIVAYLSFTLLMPPFVLGPEPTALAVAFNTTLFAILERGARLHDRQFSRADGLAPDVLQGRRARRDRGAATPWSRAVA